MKIPNFFVQKKTKLHATARASSKDVEDYDEPNMKLSSAFIVVLLLHLIAVGGIYAFNCIKDNRPSTADIEPAPPRSSEPAETEVARSTITAAANVTGGKTYRVKAGDTLAKIAVNRGVSLEELEEANGLQNTSTLRIGQEIRIPSAKTLEPRKSGDAKTGSSNAAARESGEVYTVAKGDNPVAIARKLGVSYDELLKLNKIDDPKKLQIGQRLHLPAKIRN